VPRSLRDGAVESARSGASIRQALGFIRRDHVVMMLFITTTLASLVISSFGPLMLPVYANQVLRDPLALGLSVAAYGTGGLAGTFLYGTFARRWPRYRLYLGMYLVAWIPFAALGLLQPALGGLMVAAFLIGLWPGLLAPMSQTVRLERTPEALRARVIGLTTGSFQLAGPVAILVTGVLIERGGLSPTLLMLAVTELGIAAVVLFHPATRHLDDSRPPEELGILERASSSASISPARHRRQVKLPR
jgi:predicted MFS family arabinose efflux permease